jgi:uncharacterized membrane protein YccC
MSDQAAQERFGWLHRLHVRIRGWTPEVRQTIRTLVSVFLADLVAHVLHLGEPYWALITAVIVTQARISSTLEAGRDQILGTLIGAVAGAGAIALSLAGLPKTVVFSALLVPLALLAAFKPNLRLAGVTLVVVFLFPAQGSPFSRPVDRVLAILVGAVVSLAVSYFVFHTRARQLAFQAASDMLATLDATQREVLTRYVPIAEVEQRNDVSTEALKTLVAAIAEANRERFAIIEQHDPLMVRLVPMLRRLQSDVLFVARAIDETATAHEAPVAQLAQVSESITSSFRSLQAALDEEAQSHTHHADQAAREAQALAGTLDLLGDGAGPLTRFTLQMLSRDIADVAAALLPEPPRR